MITLNTRINGLDIKIVKKICRIVINWYFDHFGQKNWKGKPLRIELDFDINTVDYAEYDIEEDERVIKLFMKQNKTIKDIISSLNHEIIHDKQSDTEYQELAKKYSYSKHPHEIEARKFSEKYTSVCWGDIKDRVNKLINRK